MNIGFSESPQIEFKSNLPKNQQILKTVVAFANGYGGKIYLGVDNSGRIVGITDNEAQRLLEYLEKSIYEACSPPIFATLSTRRFEDKVVLVIEVSRGGQPPYKITQLGLDEGVFVRVGRSTMKAHVETIQELKWRSRGVTFDAIPEYHADLSELDLEKVLRFLQARKIGYAGSHITEDLWLSYRLAEREHGKLVPTGGALLLFGQRPERFFPEQHIVCTQLADDEGRDVVATIDCKGDLFAQLDQAWHFLTSRVMTAFKIRNLVREEKTELPLEALREALVNAIMHRDYAVPAPTKIAIDPQKIIIFSPGAFPGPIPDADLEAGITYIRNAVISRCFRERGLAEKLGTGFITIFKKYREFHLSSPTILEGPNFVKVILPRQAAEAEKNSTSDEAMILALLAHNKTITTALVVQETRLSRATVVRRLGQLVADGKLTKTGDGVRTRYSLGTVKP